MAVYELQTQGSNIGKRATNMPPLVGTNAFSNLFLSSSFGDLCLGQPRQELASSDLPNTLPLPNIFSYLPHLKEHVDGLTPNIVLGQGRRGGNGANS